MRWCLFVLIFLLVGCASTARQSPQSWIYKGHCVKADLGGQDYLADCTDSLITLDYPSGASAIAFLLTGGRRVIFLAGDDAKLHPSHTNGVALEVSLVTESEERDFSSAVVVCDRTRETPVPKFIECIGQAETKPVFFTFETDGALPVSGETEK
jgi:hypothetical protein